MDNQFDIKRILVSDDNIFIYKLTSNSKDIKRMSRFLNKQPESHIEPWGNRYTLKECGKRISLCDKGDILLCAIIEKKDGYQVVGLIGYNYNEEYIIPEFAKCNFSHVIIDSMCLRRSLATQSMKLLLQYLKTKETNFTKIYAAIYDENKGSIILHKQLGFVFVKKKLGINVLEYKLK